VVVQRLRHWNPLESGIETFWNRTATPVTCVFGESWWILVTGLALSQ
jgi:hypothetical protein